MKDKKWVDKKWLKKGKRVSITLYIFNSVKKKFEFISLYGTITRINEEKTEFVLNKGRTIPVNSVYSVKEITK